MPVGNGTGGAASAWTGDISEMTELFRRLGHCTWRGGGVTGQPGPHPTQRGSSRQIHLLPFALVLAGFIQRTLREWFFLFIL